MQLNDSPAPDWHFVGCPNDSVGEDQDGFEECFDCDVLNGPTGNPKCAGVWERKGEADAT